MLFFNFKDLVVSEMHLLLDWELMLIIPLVEYRRQVKLILMFRSFAKITNIPGTGEVIIKAGLGFDILKRVQYKGETINEAAQIACDLMLERHGGSGGVVAIDKNGDVGIGFSSNQMAWAYQKGNKVFYGVDKDQTLEIDV